MKRIFVFLFSVSTLLLLGAGCNSTPPNPTPGSPAIPSASTPSNINNPQPAVNNPPASNGVACTLELKRCPDGSMVGRIPPNCDFVACPPPSVNVPPAAPNANNQQPNINNGVVCTQDAKQCSDGSYVSRIPPNCDFAACPPSPVNVTPPPSTNNQPTISKESVSISNFSFNPTTLTVKKGTMVTWTNNDPVGHTITVDSGSSPSSGTLNNGDSYSFTFDTVGTYAYHCNIHKSMQGTVIVTQ